MFVYRHIFVCVSVCVYVCLYACVLYCNNCCRDLIKGTGWSKMATGHISVNIEDILTKFGVLVSCTNSTLYVKFGLISSCILILINICNVTEGAHPCKFF